MQELSCINSDKYWALKKENKKLLQITKLRMLRMICGKTLRYGMNNKTDCEMTDVKKMEKFMSEQKLRWFEHMSKMDDEQAPVNAKNYVINGSKKGRRIKEWKKIIKNISWLEV